MQTISRIVAAMLRLKLILFASPNLMQRLSSTHGLIVNRMVGRYNELEVNNMTDAELIDPLLTVLRKRVTQDLRRQTARAGGDTLAARRSYVAALRALGDEVEGEQ